VIQAVALVAWTEYRLQIPVRTATWTTPRAAIDSDPTSASFSPLPFDAGEFLPVNLLNHGKLDSETEMRLILVSRR
jgi:hypothetical protein